MMIKITLNDKRKRNLPQQKPKKKMRKYNLNPMKPLLKKRNM